MTTIVPAPSRSQVASQPSDVIVSPPIGPRPEAVPSRQAWLNQIVEAALALVFGGGSPVSAAGNAGLRDASASSQVIPGTAEPQGELPFSNASYGPVSANSGQLGNVSRVIGPAVHIAASTLGGGPTTRSDVVAGYGAVS